MDEFIIYGFFPIILLTNFQNLNLSQSSKQFIRFYIGFIVCVFISTFFGYFTLGVPTSIRDFFEIVTILKYLLVFLTIYSFKITLPEIKQIIYFILFAIIISGIFGLFQYFGVLGLDDITGPLFLQDRIHIIHKRLTGTYLNPNTYSAILVTGHLIALGLFFFEEEKAKKTLLLIFIALLSIFLLFAGSRTMIAAYFLVTVIMTLIGAYKAGYKASQILTVLLILVLAFISAISLISYEIFIRLQSGLDIFSDTSFALRLVAWYLNILIFLQSPIVGWGPAKAIHTTVVDSEYIFILRRYGVVGFITYLSIYIHPLITAYKQLKNKSKISLLYSSIIFCVIITYLIANLTNTLFHNNQVMDFWMVFLALFYKVLDSKMSESV
ncbi:MAG: hypothetical protein FH748_11760 [Balneolaceae bacterium]|nr:hypothetical protein [Balneolaceae bacterium]